MLRAALAGRVFVEGSRTTDGYSVDWAKLPPSGTKSGAAGPAVARVRAIGRLWTGFLDPLEDALFLTAALRHLGYPAVFCLGREIVPVVPPAAFLAWVESGGDVVSTSVPVREQFALIWSLP